MPQLGRDKARCPCGYVSSSPPVRTGLATYRCIRLHTFRSVLVLALWHDVHTGWRLLMRSASVGSLNFARSIIWSISTSLGWSGFPLLSQISDRLSAQIVPLRRITSSRWSLLPCLSSFPLQRLSYQRNFSRLISSFLYRTLLQVFLK